MLKKIAILAFAGLPLVAADKEKKENQAVAENQYVKVPKINFSGIVGFEGALANQTFNLPSEANIRSVNFGLGVLFLNAAAVGESENGLIYSLNARIFTDTNKTYINPVEVTQEGIKAELQKQLTINKVMQPVTVFDRLWIELKGKYWGTFHAGNYIGANDLMVEDASSVMGGNGGMINGNWFEYANVPYGVLTSYRQTGDTRAATKVSYYTPRFGKLLQLGLSYAPRSDVFGGGSFAQIPLNLGNAAENVWSFGANLTKEISGVNIKLAASGVTGSPIDSQGRTNTLTDVLTFETAGHVITGPIDFALGFLQNGTSLLKKEDVANGKNAGSLYDAAIAYSFGSLKVALGGVWTFANLAKVDNSDSFVTKLNAYSLTADYKILNGLTAYIDITKFNGETDDAHDAVTTKGSTPSNSGYVGFLGLNVSF